MTRNWSPSVVGEASRAGPPRAEPPRLTPWHPTTQQAVTALVVAILTAASGFIGAQCNVATKAQLDAVDTRLSGAVTSLGADFRQHAGLEEHQREQIGVSVDRLQDRFDEEFPPKPKPKRRRGE